MKSSKTILASLSLGLSYGAVWAAPQTAQDPEKFVESVGINVKLGYMDTPYKDFERTKAKLQEAGIRHIRDGLGQSERINELGAVGIKIMAILSPSRAGMTRDEQKAEILETLGRVKGSLHAIEGPNEPDGGYSPHLQPFPQAVIDYQKLLFETVKASPDFRDFPVVAPSISYPPNSAKMPNTPADWGNIHSYHGGLPPETDEKNLDLPKFYLENANIQTPGKPVSATETGYPTNQFDDPNLWMPRVSEWAQGKYTLRTFCHYFSQGIVSTYPHELIDEHLQKGVAESNFGLLRHDWSEKPAFTGLKNLLNLLSDRPAPNAAPFAPGALDFSIEGEADKVRQLLFQKRNGVFYLVLWQPAKSYDPQKKLDIGVADAKIRLNFNQPISNALIYSPLSFERAGSVAKNPRTMELGVPDYPLVLELTPSGPDLVVSDFTMSDLETGGAPRVGKKAILRATLKNAGSFPTVPHVPHAVTFFEKAGEKSNMMTYGLAKETILKAGETAVVEAQWTPKVAGNLKVEAQADDVDRIGEKDEENNTLQKNFVVDP